MAQVLSTSITRRGVVAGLALAAAPVVLAGADNAHAQAKQATPEKSLYERLGGVFAIAAVVDHFSDAVVKNRVVGKKSKNPQLQEWHTKNLGRLPGLKFMRTLWVCNFSGGPFQYMVRSWTTIVSLISIYKRLRAFEATLADKPLDVIEAEVSPAPGQ